MKPETQAQVLVEALPYIQKYRGKTIVIKYGGNAMIDEALKMAVIQDVVLLNMVGVHVVLVHGGGPEISNLLEKSVKNTIYQWPSLYRCGNNGICTDGLMWKSQ